jgi:hypothetical protein
LKKKYGSEAKQGLCRIRSNQEQKELYKTPLLVAVINGASLDWLGHVMGMDKTNMGKEYSESVPESRRKR